MSLIDFRNQYPQYNDLSDEELADALHSKYYSDIDKDEYLNPHKHWQSNISFAYYLKKPLNSGNIVFSFNENPNEIADKLFSYDKLQKGLLIDINNLNQSVFEIDALEDEIVIFPSKTAHSTLRNLSNEDRISISGDISIMLKNSNQFEHLLPNPNFWQKF